MAMSDPVRVRGLKHSAVIDFELQNWRSHPVRVRGLKRFRVFPNPLQIGRTPCGCVG